MPSVNPGPATTQNSALLAVMAPQISVNPNSQGQGTNALRLLGVARAVNGNSTGDAQLMQIINSSSWLPVSMLAANGQVSGVAGSIATLSVGLYSAAAQGGTAIKTAAALASNTAASSAIIIATTVTAVAQSFQSIYVNVGTALANSTVDLFLYGYDLT